MAITNPTRLITVERLKYYKSKTDVEYKAALPSLAKEADIRAIVTGYIQKI